jgi:hypothetical protein
MKRPVSAAGLLCMALACGAGGIAQAATVWNESTDGDLSNDRLAPSPLGLASGSNVVQATVGDGGMGIDRDYFSITVPTGAALTGLTFTPYTSVSGGSSFIALEAGPQMTVTPTGAGIADLLGFTHYGNDAIGFDLLPLLASGLNGVLPGGIYTLWVQETGGPATYGIDFTVTPVPLPGATVLLVSGLFGLAGLRRRGRPTRLG